MYEEVQVLTHSSIRIAGNQIIYFDPFNVEGEPHDADIICVTHDHFDHYSPEDLAKVKNAATILVCPKTMKDALSNSGISEEFTELVAPGDEMEINGVRIQAVPAYNVGKQFHLQANQWVGYLVTMNNVIYYIAGDTDINEDVKKVRCDVALLPVGGTYTMTAEEASKLAEIIHPKAAIPTHYGSVAGKAEDGQIFADLLKDKINAIIKM